MYSQSLRNSRRVLRAPDANEARIPVVPFFKCHWCAVALLSLSLFLPLSSCLIDGFSGSINSTTDIYCCLVFSSGWAGAIGSESSPPWCAHEKRREG